MEITVTSECDSRQFIYPLLKCLKSFGSICVYTNNPMMNRLVEEGSEGFGNVSIYPLYPTYSGDLTIAMEDSEYAPDKWDFVIWDNVGRMEYDYHFVLVTSRVSDSYMQDALTIIDDDNVHILKMGTPSKIKDPSKNKCKCKKGNQEDEDQVVGNEYNKWSVERTEEDIFVEKLTTKDAIWIPWTPMEAIEEIEAFHRCPIPNDKFISEVYRLLGDSLAIDKRIFVKGVRLDEESKNCCTIAGVDVR